MYIIYIYIYIYICIFVVHICIYSGFLLESPDGLSAASSDGNFTFASSGVTTLSSGEVLMKFW